mmetsp:Transcript_17290/g.37771  ORF Transcript_17290/g.37771 Transcript_17290/m.37771 type:complete len:710 (-) Transcript_17290:649-2778(-)
MGNARRLVGWVYCLVIALECALANQGGHAIGSHGSHSLQGGSHAVNVHSASHGSSRANGHANPKEGGKHETHEAEPVSPKVRKRRKVGVTIKHALKQVFGSFQNAVATGTESEITNGLKKMEKLMQYCAFDLEDIELSENAGEADVADQLAAVLSKAEIENVLSKAEVDSGVETNNFHSASSNLDPPSETKKETTPKKKNSNKFTKFISTDKQEISRLRKLVKKLKDHQAAEVNKLVAVKKGVESLVRSLSGTKKNLLVAKRESLDMENELDKIHRQAAAAADLEKEISEIQEHARINYETGQVELELETGETSHLSLNEVAAKVQLAKLEKGQGHRDSTHSRRDADDILSNLADPAVLHADLRLLLDIVLLLGSATIGGILAAVVYMPPIIGYIAGGIIVGPSGLNLVHTVVEVDTLAQFGSVFFLFAHGLEYSFSEQRQFQTVAVGGCLLSTAMCAVCIQLYALASGIVQSPLEGALIGLSSSLSSLSLILDYLHEQRLVHSVHGKVMVGFLTFQGLMMGLLFSLPPAISGGVVSVGGVGYALFRSLSGILFVAAFAYFFSKYALPTILEFLTKDRANYDELYLLGIVSLAMVMALFTEFLGLSLDLGAFFAGLMLAESPYMKRTAAAIQPLANVFAAMLFASIGMIINPMFFWTNLGVILIVVVQIVVIKVIVVTTVVRLFSYSWRISIVSGIGLAHVGEFSLLFF